MAEPGLDLHAADLALKDKVEALQREIDQLDHLGHEVVADRHLSRAELYAAGYLALHVHLRIWPSDDRTETSDWCFVVKPVGQVYEHGRLGRFKDVLVVADGQMEGSRADGCDLADEQPMFVLIREFPERALRHLLDKLFFRLSDSDLEIYFRRIVRAAKLPTPLTKQRVNKFEVDFFWPDLGLVVETDGLRYHRTPSAQLRDARRDRAHVMAGMTPLRFTHYEVRYEPSRVRAELAKTIAMLRKRTRF